MVDPNYTEAKQLALGEGIMFIVTASWKCDFKKCTALWKTGTTAAARSCAYCINLAWTPSIMRLTLFPHELCFLHLQWNHIIPNVRDDLQSDSGREAEKRILPSTHCPWHSTSLLAYIRPHALPAKTARYSVSVTECAQVSWVMILINWLLVSTERLGPG